MLCILLGDELTPKITFLNYEAPFRLPLRIAKSRQVKSQKSKAPKKMAKKLASQKLKLIPKPFYLITRYFTITAFSLYGGKGSIKQLKSIPV